MPVAKVFPELIESDPGQKILEVAATFATADPEQMEGFNPVRSGRCLSLVKVLGCITCIY